MKLFTRKKDSRPPYHIITVDYDSSQFSGLGDVLGDMTENQIDGVLIKNFLSKEMAQLLINGFEQLPEDELVLAEKGFHMYPTPFAMFSHLLKQSKEEHDRLLMESETIWREFPDRFGVDFYARLTECIESIAGNRTLLNVPGEDTVGFYHPAGFRRLAPDQGKFTVHCGNFFHDEFSEFFQHLQKFIPIERQLSYFVTLQRSPKGGDIILYDVRWDEAQERLNDGQIIKKLDGTELHISDETQLKRMVVEPQVGDLLIFASAQVWHKVTKPQITERYTLGGFLGISHDQKSVYVWS